MSAEQLSDSGPASEEPDSPGAHLLIDAAPLLVDVELATLWHDFHASGMTEMKAAIQQALTLAATSAGLTQGPFELSVALVDDKRIQMLNKVWRGQDKPTNVLSFPGIEPSEMSAATGTADTAPKLLGDIVIARETVDAEAQAQGKTPVDHFLHLLVHGFLHLCGFDHVEDKDAERMESLETTILADMDIAAPYERAEKV
ncbi:MAG: rRNA maturation RNase YbeY [Parvibaculales bacterium]